VEAYPVNKLIEDKLFVDR